MSKTRSLPDTLLLQLIESVGTVKGKKALQKLMYFINIKKDRYRFKWNRFGPFSEELSYHLDDLVFENLVEVAPKPLLTKPGHQYNVNLSEKGKNILKTHRISSADRRIVKEVAALFGERTPRELELLASVHYILAWAKHRNKRLLTNDICSLICELKPDSGFTEQEVKNALEFLKRNHIYF